MVIHLIYLDLLIEYELRETIAAERYLPVIEESKEKLEQQTNKTRILTEQLSALVKLFKQKEDSWKESLEKLKQAHSRKLKKKERDINEYQKLLDGKNLEIKGILTEFGELEQEWKNMPSEPEKLKKKKKSKKKSKMNNTIRKARLSKNSKNGLKKQEKRLEKIQNTVNLIKKEFNTNY
jgi:exonuclease VII large subunit